MKRVLYPGSFDPITLGHMNIINQASNLFDEVIVAILVNPNKKNSFFTMEERLNIISKLYEGYDNIKVIASFDPACDVAIQNDCVAIVRGLRGLSDYDYEVQLQQINKDISNNKINTVCLFADKDYQFISSSIVKEVYNINKSIINYVDPYVEEQMQLKRRR